MAMHHIKHQLDGAEGGMLKSAGAWEQLKTMHGEEQADFVWSCMIPFPLMGSQKLTGL